MLLSTIILLASVANLLIGCYVLLTKPSARERQAFFLFVVGIAIWISGMLLLSVTQDFRFDKVTHYGALLLLVGLTWFAQLFPRPCPAPLPQWLVYGPLLLTGLLLIPSNRIVTGIEPLPDGDLAIMLGPGMPLWAARCPR